MLYKVIELPFKEEFAQKCKRIVTFCSAQCRYISGATTAKQRCSVLPENCSLLDLIQNVKKKKKNDNKLITIDKMP